LGPKQQKKYGVPELCVGTRGIRKKKFVVLEGQKFFLGGYFIVKAKVLYNIVGDLEQNCFLAFGGKSYSLFLARRKKSFGCLLNFWGGSQTNC